jgi:hypothetical protein
MIKTQASEVESPFQRLFAINVNDHVEKKNNLSYLTWAWAVAELLKADPIATWEYKEPVRWNDTVMVFCTVTAFGKQMTAQLPVMDHRNKAISNPDAFAVNTAMQRCLAKAIALHGLGLYIYSGEDLPESEAEAFAKKASEKGVTPTAGAMEHMSEAERKFISEFAEGIQQHFNDGTATPAELVSMLEERHLDAEEKVAVWSLLDSKVRSAIKKAHETAKIADSIAGQA